MRRLVFMIVIIALVGGCRGEPAPRDYQNAPPAMTHPPQTKSETPAQHGMGQAPPAPDTGVSTAAPTKPTSATDTATTTIGDTKPVTTTHT